MRKFFWNNEKKIVNICIVCFLMIACVVSLYIVASNPLKYFEIDSYSLPAVSIQHRGTIIMEQQDIDQAKIDFPILYNNVSCYDELRSSKLFALDDNHWIAFYFPIYAIICLPMKLILSLFHWYQDYAFTLTNALLLLLTLLFVIKYYSKENKERGLLCAFLVFCCPILFYLRYIGAEPVMFCIATMAFILWKNENYKIAAFIISLASMANPTFMGIGIIMFLEYIYSRYKISNVFLKSKSFWLDIAKLCSCYIPSLIPIAFNLAVIGRISTIFTIGDSSNPATFDSLIERILAYFFDLNLGLASISIIMVVVFIFALPFAIITKDIKLLFMWIAVVFTVFCFSLMAHINCGMFLCARYVLWIYPGVIVVVSDFVIKFFSKKKNWANAILALCIISCITVYLYNGYYSFTEFSRVSKFILNRTPQYYVSFCDSTFYTRAMNDASGGYNTNGYAIYCDHRTDEVRKIMYLGTENNHKQLLRMIESDDDKSLTAIKREFKDDKKTSLCSFSNGRFEKNQYYLKDIYAYELADVVKRLYSGCYGEEISIEECEKVSKGMLKHDEDYYNLITSWIEKMSKDDEEFIINLYVYALCWYPKDEEIKSAIDYLNDGFSKSQLVQNRIERVYDY